jgi:hypothetical protein
MQKLQVGLATLVILLTKFTLLNFLTQIIADNLANHEKSFAIKGKTSRKCAKKKL